MNYTPFGEFFRMLRIKHHEILSDASDLLRVSSAYVSSVECGKRPVPEEWVKIIIDHYKLNEKEQKELADAVERSKTSIKINLSAATYPQRTAAIQFQRSFDDMDDETANEILKIIERNNKGGL
jgi:transcriptional regulator with XRE-family HTH domain